MQILLLSFINWYRMSISVKNITKIYGKQKALDDISFEVQPGEIVGFLGPNGAGKSTMMKIITCFIPQTSGKASVCGFDVEEQCMKVKKKVGYLPENNSLYVEMYVKEYLSFIAGLHKLKDKKKKVSEIINTVGLEVEQHKKIGALSKGYRQRVGLAQAMIHNPEVLILDEPTSGLDPNQIVEIRKLIKNIGKEKTVIMSTHIMQEVEALCDRVIIIDKGKIVADNSASQLKRSSKTQQVIVVEFNESPKKEDLMKIKGVEKVKRKQDNVWLIHPLQDEDIRDRVFQFAVDNGIKVLAMQQEEHRLEDIFRELTTN